MNHKTLRLKWGRYVLALFAVMGLVLSMPVLRTRAQTVQTGLPIPPFIYHLPFVSTAQHRTGWIVGWQTTSYASVILHTADGGTTWQPQGDPSLLANSTGADISAVDDLTAWAALTGETSGVILHTTDGGTTWVSQTIPPGVTGGMKAVKGLSRQVAWAASLNGAILHTTDGGATWTLVPHPTAPIIQVNRIDALGETDVWIADSAPGGSIAHTQDNGLTWRQEILPPIEGASIPDNPLTVQAFSNTTVWASGTQGAIFYRTVDGGSQWQTADAVGGFDHLDDICAASADDVWGVQNGGVVSGSIWRVHMTANGSPQVQNVTPPELLGYTPSGITCLDTEEAWVVGNKGVVPDPTKPSSIILYTSDGGQHWSMQTPPMNSNLWKISSPGMHR